MESCEYCGEEYTLDILDVFSEERTFLLDTCCESVHDEAVAELNAGADRRAIAGFFRDAAGLDVRQVVSDDSGRWDNAGLTLDWGLTLQPIRLNDAKAWIREHHRHVSNPPVSWRWGHAVYNGPDLVGVAMVGRPVARKLDHTRIVEVNRVCVDDDLPAWMRWNACSMLYGAACREAKRRGFERVVTYTLESESASTVKAAGFVREAETNGGSWSRKNRKRTDKAPTCRKVRWGRKV